MLGRQIAARQPPPTCLPELRRALLDEWCNIPQDQIDNLILSIPRRYMSVNVAARPSKITQVKDGQKPLSSEKCKSCWTIGELS
ncbi:polypeptide N-acetylgalactosaminyltransferase 13 [Trichonephila clavipes]|nr:polypeptide N-acetylgalactosaminyltransferase 13 [Trichonephila clavipes]